MISMHKYPRTQHIEGSRLQPGDEDLACVPFEEIRGRHIVAEEKLDGANAGLRFDSTGRLWLQSRGHFLGGGVREKHFSLFKQWAAAHTAALWQALGARYALYGEWLFAKHTVYYDVLPHYFLEFDVLDFEAGQFLSTPRRRELLAGTPLVAVPVLYAGRATTLGDLAALVGPSLFKGPDWRRHLIEACAAEGIGEEQAWLETDALDLMEGLYIKVEDEEHILGRYKYVRASFLTAVRDSGTHWLRRPIVANGLAGDADLFGAGVGP
jgi:RNA ligase